MGHELQVYQGAYLLVIGIGRQGFWNFGAPNDTHQGIPIPRPLCHNAMKFMRMVGPEGLEPGDIGYGSLLGYLSRPDMSWTVPGIHVPSGIRYLVADTRGRTPRTFGMGQDTEISSFSRDDVPWLPDISNSTSPVCI